MIIDTYAGELAALLVAVFWTITALSFELATKRIGSLSVNITRLLFGFLFLSLFTTIRRGMPLPLDAGAHQWIYLSLSGLVGFIFGDYFLFASYQLITSRIAMLIMTFVPPVTAFLGWLFLGESMSLQHLAGMTLTVAGIVLTVVSRPDGGKMKLRYPAKGIFFAFLGVLGQAGGLILSKIGMADYDPFASTQIRIITGFFGFLAIILFTGRLGKVWQSLRDRKALAGITSGSFFGPFLGVSFSLIAIRHTSTGIASTLMAIVPILIIAPSALIFKQKVGAADYIGAIISVAGVVLFFV
ncbi:MAG TPA: DMT family transporter [Bacteroidales bacterium]|nr:DMT family transporter [Bacteroidales bacterium]